MNSQIQLMIGLPLPVCQINNFILFILRNIFVDIQSLSQIIISQMVKIQAFKGYTYSSQDYDILLKFNHQSLQKLREYTRAYILRTNICDQISNGVLSEDKNPCFYIYSQRFMNKTALGLMAEISVEDYINGNIKVHQKTLCRQGLNAQTYRQDHVGPIVLSYQGIEFFEIKKIMIDITEKSLPFTVWKTADDREHKLWKIQSDIGLKQYFQNVKNLYVLDGHHRLKAATENYQIYGQSINNSKLNWIQALIYPPEQVSVHSFHRVINQMPQKFNILKFLQQNKIQYQLLRKARESDLEKYQIIFKNNEGIFGINFQDEGRNCIQKLSAYKLKSNILDPIYETQLDKHLNFIPGINNWEQLLEKNKSIFLLRSVKIEQVFKIADENEIMPPKSTWFEPKPCNHMVIRLPY